MSLIKLLCINECLVNFFFLRPEVHIKLCVFTEFNPVPILGWNSGKLPGINNNSHFGLGGMLIAKAVKGHAAGHYAELAKDALSRIVVIE